MGGAIILCGSALYLKVYNVEVTFGEKIHNVEVQVHNVEKGLNEKLHKVGLKVQDVEIKKDELHA